jgi:hypothetical protein
MHTNGLKLRSLVVVVVCVAIAGVARSDLTPTNSAGVRAGITGIIYHPASTNGPASMGVSWIVVHPTSTNSTSFTMQQNFDLKTANLWSDSTSTVTVNGVGTHTGEAGNLASPTNQFFRMRLINFR